MATTSFSISFINLSSSLTTAPNRSVKFGTSYVPQSIRRIRGFPFASLRWKSERRSEGKMNVRCEAVVAEKEAEESSGGEKFECQGEESRILDLIVHRLYSLKEVFLWELASNASDALDKLRFLSVTEPSLLGDAGDLEIRIKPDPDNGTITITDAGIGITREELIDCLGTIAQSGTSKFLKAHKVPRRNIIGSLVSSFIFSQLGCNEVTLAEPSVGFMEHIDVFDGYSFLYPKNWIQVKGAGADIFFRDPFVLDENISVELSSPSSSRYKSVEDLGPPEAAAEKVLKQYLTEFMSTRLGVRRESNILTTSSRVADDGKLYYQVEVNIKSFASNNELAVMPQDRIPRLEWDRRYLSVLGVGNNRLYELRLQTPENVFSEEEKELRQVMDSFRVLEAVK